MSRTRIVKGKITEVVGGDYNLYSAKSIVENSLQTISEKADKGISFGEPKEPPSIQGTITDTYFAKKEYTKYTNESAGKYPYKFRGDNPTSTHDEKKGVAETILNNIKDDLTNEKKYTIVSTIISNLTKSSYAKNEVIEIDTLKIAPYFKKIESAPLDEKIYLVVKAGGLNGEKATIKIKEKDGILTGSEGGDLKVLKLSEEQMEASDEEVQGTETTEFEEEIKEGKIRIPIRLRPKSDEDLKEWKDKISKNKHILLYISINDNEYEFLKKEGYYFKLIACSCSGNLSEKKLKKIATNASSSNIKAHINGINDAFEDNDINDCLRRIHFLAQVIHESGSFRYTKEIGVSNSAYGGFPGRGLIQLTGKTNYSKYGHFVNEDVTSNLENKEKLEKDPHAAKSAGWYWQQHANLNNPADENDFIYITYAINGGFNGYDDRLIYVKKGFEELLNLNKEEIKNKSNYLLKDSKCNNMKKASFAWGLWHDTETNKNGVTKNNQLALEGYQRYVDLSEKTDSTTNYYGIQNMNTFSNLVEYKKVNNKNVKHVNVRKAALQRIKEIKNEKN